MKRLTFLFLLAALSYASSIENVERYILELDFERAQTELNALSNNPIIPDLETPAQYATYQSFIDLGNYFLGDVPDYLVQNLNFDHNYLEDFISYIKFAAVSSENEPNQSAQTGNNNDYGAGLSIIEEFGDVSLLLSESPRVCYLKRDETEQPFPMKNGSSNFVLNDNMIPIGAESRSASVLSLLIYWEPYNAYYTFLLDNNGYFISFETTGNISNLAESTLHELEISFKQDLNDDGKVGSVPTFTFPETTSIPLYEIFDLSYGEQYVVDYWQTFLGMDFYTNNINTYYINNILEIEPKNKFGKNYIKIKNPINQELVANTYELNYASLSYGFIQDGPDVIVPFPDVEMPDISEPLPDLGETFIDTNNDGIWNDSVQAVLGDNPNTPAIESNFVITPAVAAEFYTDTNGNGVYDNAEVDINENGIADAFVEQFIDDNLNGLYDLGEVYTDLNENDQWDAGEPFVDAGDGVWNAAEAYIDANGNQQYDVGEAFTDEDGDNVWDDAEVLTFDLDNDGEFDSAFVEDFNEDGYLGDQINYGYYGYFFDFNEDGIYNHGTDLATIDYLESYLNESEIFYFPEGESKISFIYSGDISKQCSFKLTDWDTSGFTRIYINGQRIGELDSIYNGYHYDGNGNNIPNIDRISRIDLYELNPTRYNENYIHLFLNPDDIVSFEFDGHAYNWFHWPLNDILDDYYQNTTDWSRLGRGIMPVDEFGNANETDFTVLPGQIFSYENGEPNFGENVSLDNFLSGLKSQDSVSRELIQKIISNLDSFNENSIVILESDFTGFPEDLTIKHEDSLIFKGILTFIDVLLGMIDQYNIDLTEDQLLALAELPETFQFNDVYNIYNEMLEVIPSKLYDHSDNKAALLNAISDLKTGIEKIYQRQLNESLFSNYIIEIDIDNEQKDELFNELEIFENLISDFVDVDTTDAVSTEFSLAPFFSTAPFPLKQAILDAEENSDMGILDEEALNMLVDYGFVRNLLPSNYNGEIIAFYDNQGDFIGSLLFDDDYYEIDQLNSEFELYNPNAPENPTSYLFDYPYRSYHIGVSDERSGTWSTDEAINGYSSSGTYFHYSSTLDMNSNGLPDSMENLLEITYPQTLSTQLIFNKESSSYTYLESLTNYIQMYEDYGALGGLNLVAQDSSLFDFPNRFTYGFNYYVSNENSISSRNDSSSYQNHYEYSYNNGVETLDGFVNYPIYGERIATLFDGTPFDSEQYDYNHEYVQNHFVAATISSISYIFDSTYGGTLIYSINPNYIYYQGSAHTYIPEWFQDVNGNGAYDEGEPFADNNYNGVHDLAEDFPLEMKTARFVMYPDYLDMDNDGLPDGDEIKMGITPNLSSLPTSAEITSKIQAYQQENPSEQNPIMASSPYLDDDQDGMPDVIEEYFSQSTGASSFNGEDGDLTYNFLTSLILDQNESSPDFVYTDDDLDGIPDEIENKWASSTGASSSNSNDARLTYDFIINNVYTLPDLMDMAKDLRLGSTTIEIHNGLASFNIMLEESTDLENWNEYQTYQMDLENISNNDIKFYRFKMLPETN